MKILTYNIQAGIGTQSTRDLVLGVRRQFRDSARKRENLAAIGAFIADFDIVCLQELGLGGQRSGGESQLPILQAASGHAYVAVQTNRIVGKLSRHGNAILSRYPIENIRDRKLPSRVPGRGKIICEIAGLTIVNTHLSLASKTQAEQLMFIAAELAEAQNIVMCGDLNLRARSPLLQAFSELRDMRLVTNNATKTYPSWKPRRDLDHILLSRNLEAGPVQVHHLPHSDHLPVSVSLKT